MQAVDYVVVIYKEELGMLALQAASARRFLKSEDVNKYIIIINYEYGYCADFIKSHIVPLFGHLQDKVVLVEIGDLARFPAKSYLLQQVAKLSISRLLHDSQFYTCLDAKNFFIRSPGEGDLFLKEKPTARTEYLSGVTQTITNEYYSELFGIAPLAHGSLAMAIMTPFTVNVGIAIDLIGKLEELTGREFSEAFCDSKTQSEFMLYATYMRYIGYDPIKYYKRNVLLSRTVWSRSWLEDSTLKDIFAFAKTRGFLMVALHRRVLGSLTESEQREFVEFVEELELSDSIRWIADCFWAEQT